MAASSGDRRGPSARSPVPAENLRLPDGRVRPAIERVEPELDAGVFAIKRTVGEPVRVTAWIHADGHDALAAVVRYRPLDASRAWREAPMRPLGNDEWTGEFIIDRQCLHEYTVHAWIDRFESWRKGLAAKTAAGQDVSIELTEGAALLRAAAGRARRQQARVEARWLDARAAFIAGPRDPAERARAALDARVADAARRYPDRRHAAAYDRALPIVVDRPRARCGAWYEMFPRSWGPDPSRSATFREAAAHLERVAAMGFDVVYLPPIHPIGTTFRKGRGNALQAAPGDPGSPWAIGSEAGGHTAVDPGLGTIGDFDDFVARAAELGLEVALDLALQCSPDHPYVREHPEWLRHRPDGTIKYAENPPKKYQDIYPFDFECDDWRGLWQELRRIVEFWIAHGVSIFRVDNPHTKPYRFWEWLIREIRRAHPDTIFLAEAFTRPKVMYYLAKLGFTQSYTYFTWRNTKAELTEYFEELSGTGVREFFRPNLFANTPDILHDYLQRGGAAAFSVRLVLAATLGANYGIYSGFELCENRAVPGTEEYLESEKYQFRAWDWDRPGHIRDLAAAVNRIRREHPALQGDRGLTFCATDNPNLIAYCKTAPAGGDAVLVVVNLDCDNLQHGWITLSPADLDLPSGDTYEVVDLLDGQRYSWRGAVNYVRLDPREKAAHILALPQRGAALRAKAASSVAASLPNERWFAGKDRRVTEIRLLDWQAPRAADAAVLPAVAAVRYEDGTCERYFVPMAASGDGFVDAALDDGACRALAAAMLDQQAFALEHGVARSDTVVRAEHPGALAIVRGGGEQSNSSIRFENQYVLKMFRRLESGPNAEAEVLRFLARRKLACIPPLISSLEYAPHDGTPAAALAVIQGFVPNRGTAWDAAVAEARNEVGSPRPRTARAGPFAASVGTLAARTADVHLALAADDADPAFAPERLTTDDTLRLAAALERDAAGAFAALAGRLDSLPPAARPIASRILGAQDALTTRIRQLAAGESGSLRTRVHGDYHLGQVLVVDGDFVILDFEGEPARPLAERRAKHSPLKDVAGMLRSFSYAGYAALGAPAAWSADGEARARAWADARSDVFLTGYRKAIAGTGLVPADDQRFAALLDLFLLEKTIYELRYELASRPDWVAIPLAGLAQLLSEGGDWPGR